jgi:hypothetical protein
VVEVVYELLLNGIVIDLSKRERLGLLLFKPRASERLLFIKVENFSFVARAAAAAARYRQQQRLFTGSYEEWCGVEGGEERYTAIGARGITQTIEIKFA